MLSLVGSLYHYPITSYPCIDVYEAEEGRMFTVLDSWVRNQEEKHEPSREQLCFQSLAVLMTFQVFLRCLGRR